MFFDLSFRNYYIHAITIWTVFSSCLKLSANDLKRIFSLIISDYRKNAYQKRIIDYSMSMFSGLYPFSSTVETFEMSTLEIENSLNISGFIIEFKSNKIRISHDYNQILNKLFYSQLSSRLFLWYFVNVSQTKNVSR